MASAARKAENVVPLREQGPAEDAVTALNLGKLKRAKTQFESANGAYRNVLKHVESKGINIAAAKEAIAIAKSGKVDEKIAELKALFDYLKILGSAVPKAQLDMFSTEAARTPAVDKARELGRHAGIMGEGSDQNPYDLSSAQGQAWMEAWHGGGKERSLILSMEPTSDELISGQSDDEGDDEGDGEGDTAESDANDKEWDDADPEKQAAE